MTDWKIAMLVLSCVGLMEVARAQNTGKSRDVEQEITTTLKQMYEAEKRKDLGFVIAHLADDFAEVSEDGKIYHRDDIVKGWPEMAVSQCEPSDFVFTLMTKDAAWLSYRLHVEATFQGVALPKEFRVTTVWTRTKGKWVIRFEQGTVLKTK